MGAGITDEALTVYAEDSAHTSGDDGSFVLAVRNDAGTSLVGTDGDYAPFSLDASGNLRVAVSGNSNSEYAEDSAHTTADVGTHILAVRNDSEGSLVSADGDYGSLQLDGSGRLRVVADLDTTSLSEKAEDSVHVSADIGDYILSVREDEPASSTSATGDYQSFKTDELGKLWTNASANSGCNHADVDVGVAATQLVAAPISGRMNLMVQNLGPQPIYIGCDNTVLATTGIRIAKNGSHRFDVGPDQDLYAISSVAQTGAANTRIMEFA